LLGTTTERSLFLDIYFWKHCTKLFPNQIASLKAPFVEEEIRKVVFSCNSNKASGSDGFFFQFYQSF
jgi:Reverse transcriptase (RNA-dependent DNA polymerase)